MSKPAAIRAVVAFLLGIEAAAFLHAGATWLPFYIAIAVLLGGLLFLRTRGWVWLTMATLAVVWAILFVVPGGFLIAIGACGFLNSSCSNAEFLQGVAAFAAAAIVNIVAAVLIVRTPPAPGKSHS